MINDSHPFAKIAVDVQQVWHPFSEELNIPYFAFEYYNVRNGHYGLITNDFYITQPYLNASIFPTQEEIHKVITQTNVIVLSPQVNIEIEGYPTKKHQQNIEIVAECGLPHRLVYLQRVGDWVSVVCYGCESSNTKGVYALLEKFNLLQQINLLMRELVAPQKKTMSQSLLTIPNYSADYLDLLDSTSSKANDNKLKTLVKKNYHLTDREFEILQMTAMGKTAKAIAKLLNNSPRTIELHLEHLKQKLNAPNKLALCEKYYRYFNVSYHGSDW